LLGCFYGHYSQAVDIWSIGCIFAETLLGKPLFPGKDTVAQLHLITDLLGKPNHDVIEQISNQKARNFLHALPQKPSRPLENKFRNSDRLALDLLKQLLSFDASSRPSALQALTHPYFQGLPEVSAMNCPQIGRSQFEFEMHKLTELDVRNLIYMEVSEVKILR
jgi:serine/threonine protein kinase